MVLAPCSLHLFSAAVYVNNSTVFAFVYRLCFPCSIVTAKCFFFLLVLGDFEVTHSRHGLQ